MSLAKSSTPTLSEFDPTIIPYQYKVIEDVRSNFDYSLGVHDVLLSGSVGSAKSILMAHVIITHCLDNERARACLGRRAMPDLKDTILAKVLEHMEEDLVEGEDYEYNKTKGYIEFSNGSEVLSRSWADRRAKRGRSLELSALAIEELTENDDEDRAAIQELRMRVGRLSHVKENIAIYATNPDSPAHWAHKHFMEDRSPTRHVYYSVTTDNPFLPAWYISQLKNELDPKMARRMIYGEWIEIAGEVVYYAYDKSVNFRDRSFEINPKYPVRLAHDFNIGEGKPMSACLFQYWEEEDEFHFFTECVVEGARTSDLMDELVERGTFEYPVKFIVHGDATGRSSDTRSKRSDYEIIESFLSHYVRKDGSKLEYEIQVPRANPPIRKRHNRVNGYMKNDLGKNRLFVYRDAPTLDRGFRLTKLKSGGQYLEDDSKAYQHVTTAAGYGVMSTIQNLGRQSGVHSE